MISIHLRREVSPFVAGFIRRSLRVRHKSSGSRPEDRFPVTGTLLDARRSGVEVPQPGQWLEVKHSFPQASVTAFAEHAGDDNPIHLNEDYAKTGGDRTYRTCIVHGLLAAGLFSTLFGRTIPGALYVSQSLKFEKPVHVGDALTARIEVKRSRTVSSGKEVILMCSTVVHNDTDNNVAISGDAVVLIPKGTQVRGSK